MYSLNPTPCGWAEQAPPLQMMGRVFNPAYPSCRLTQLLTYQRMEKLFSLFKLIKIDSIGGISTVNPESKKPSIFEGVKPYHWVVLVVASCGWLFDCMDQRIFVLARESALKELLAGDVDNVNEVLKSYIGWATMWMIFGWATGGIIFGMMSDKVGRVKTMVVTLFVYSGFTGLSAASTSWVDFTIYRFLVGLGIGGMFGAAAALVAESVPTGVRSLALGSLQTLSAMGNILGSVISLWIAPGLMQTWFGL